MRRMVELPERRKENFPIILPNHPLIYRILETLSVFFCRHAWKCRNLSWKKLKTNISRPKAFACFSTERIETNPHDYLGTLAPRRSNLHICSSLVLGYTAHVYCVHHRELEEPKMNSKLMQNSPIRIESSIMVCSLVASFLPAKCWPKTWCFSTLDPRLFSFLCCCSFPELSILHRFYV